MLPHFRTSVPGKWVLAGEHAVLRGATAVALPHPEFKLSFDFLPDGSLEIVPHAPVIRDLLASLKERYRKEDRAFPQIEGRIRVESTIPVGAGLGSSAALCVAITRWLSESLQISEREQFEFARTLEHFFHGTSSGMDVAAVSSVEPISFSMEHGHRSLGVEKIPHFTFQDTRIRTRTSECILKVEKLKEENQLQAVKTDEVMSCAARLAMEGLQKFDRGDSRALKLIADAMNQAQECFYRWDLVPAAAKQMETELRAQGALAVKLTGAGGGGFLVALWPDSLHR